MVTDWQVRPVPEGVVEHLWRVSGKESRPVCGRGKTREPSGTTYKQIDAVEKILASLDPCKWCHETAVRMHSCLL